MLHTLIVSHVHRGNTDIKTIDAINIYHINALQQHPIFPWVVADWSSDHLDLSAAATFRDLRWPMGAQSEEQVYTLYTLYTLCFTQYVYCVYFT
jgi:Beige/BEACH domain